MSKTKSQKIKILRMEGQEGRTFGDRKLIDEASDEALLEYRDFLDAKASLYNSLSPETKKLIKKFEIKKKQN